MLVQQPALLEVVNQGEKSPVDIGQDRRQTLFDAAPVNVIAMMIEIAPGAADQHESHARLDQAAGQDRLFADAVASVGNSRRFRFATHVEGTFDLAPQHHLVAVGDCNGRPCPADRCRPGRDACGQMTAAIDRDPAIGPTRTPFGMANRPINSSPLTGA